MTRRTSTMLALILASMTAGASPPQVAFTKCRNEAGERFLGDIWTIDASGAKRSLTDTGKEGFPTWSPDGRKIAFVAHRGATRGELMVMNADGTDRRVLSEMMAPMPPSWSPDGKRLAFAGWLHGDPADIYVVGVDGGSAPVRITFHGGRSPAFSPSGSRIAYMAFGEIAEFDGLCLVDPDGKNHRKLADSPARDSPPAWSPDGRSIAFQSYEAFPDTVRGDVCVIAADGRGGIRRVSDPATSAWGRAWSPDGKRIAFVSARTQGYELWLSKPDGSDRREIAQVDTIDDEFLEWTADGASLVIGATEKGRDVILAIGAEGMDRRELGDGAQPRVCRLDAAKSK